jgi:hypothetical protein
MEQGPTDIEPTTDQPTSTTLEVDPSINPTNMVVQEGEFSGAVEAFEFKRGTGIDDNGNKKQISNQPNTVEGYPVIGAYAEKNARGDPNFPANTEMSSMDEKEKQYDDVGTEAIAAKVKERAIALLPKEASDKLKEEYGELAATKFRDELKTKLAERQAAKDAIEAERQAVKDKADAETRAMIEKLKDTGTKLSDVIEVPDSPDKEPDYIDATENKSPESEETGDWRPGLIADSEQTLATPGGPIASMHLMEKDREHQESEG